MFGQMGKLAKLRVIAYDNPRYDEPSVGTYEALVNPEEFAENFEVVFNSSQALGTTGSSLRFVRIEPQSLNVNLLFDGTGVATASGLPGTGALPFQKPSSVDEQISDFKSIALEYDGTNHSPRFVKVSWGRLLFKGRLTSFQLTYTLFKPDGTPLRARGRATFRRSIENHARIAEEGNSSPDLTHIRTVAEGDTLLMMCHRIYGDAGYYLQVADFNEMDDFRNLKAGDQIYFPPIK